MSEMNNIQDRINIIFDIECGNFTSNRFHYFEKNEALESDLVIKTVVATRHQKKDLELNSADNLYLQWETYTTLKKLYNNIEKDPKSREIFIDILKEELLKVSPASSLAFYFLLKIRKNRDIIEIIERRVKEETVEYDFLIKELFEDIQKFMHCEPVYFDDYTLTNLKRLNEYLEKISQYQYKFEREINSIRYGRLQNELEGVNEEINIHKEQVIDIISKFGFPSEIGKFLLEIDKAAELPDWDLINSGMINNLRAFFEQLTKNIAEQTKQITKKEYSNDPNKSYIGNLRDYNKKHLKLSDSDDELIDAFINILHKEGGHAFLSEKRYFLLAKNIGIEIAYFLLSKLEDLSEGKIQS